MAHAFTLIELLVVITIIVVLLALLTPALDKAIYQAELAVCAANQDAVVSGVIVYTAAYRRAYPVNQVRRSDRGNSGYQPSELGSEILATSDIRPVIKDYVAFAALFDPLTGTVDLSEEANDIATQVFSSYYLWGGWIYLGPHAGKGMIRLGDKLEWNDNITTPPPGQTGSFQVRSNIMVGDTNGVQLSGFTRASHPDTDGRLRLHLAQNGANTPDDATGDLTIPAGAVRQTRADWVMGASSSPRGTMDLQYGCDDGSVTRFTGVTGRWNDVESENGQRFYAAPWLADSTNSQTTAKWWLPAER